MQHYPPLNFFWFSGASIERRGPLVTIHKRRNLPGGLVEPRPLYHCRKNCPHYQGDGWNQCAHRNRENPAYCDCRAAQAEALKALAAELALMARLLLAGEDAAAPPA